MAVIFARVATPEIQGNFSEICIKIIKNLKSNAKFSRKSFFVRCGGNLKVSINWSYNINYEEIFNF